ncbi:hypothetical protein G9A89_020188 [Geosiphon pyriformis]|nr:hypothetical protein G9A89_020188 [Geosiphon pyriformis]
MATSLARKKRIDVNSDLKRQEMSQADLLAFKWSFLIGKDSVHMAKAMGDHETWASRDWFRALLFILLMGTTVHDFGTFLEGAGGKTCVINRSLETGNRIHCAIVSFETNNDLESVFHTEPILGDIKLSWARLDLVWCEKCGKFGHSALECDTPVVSPSMLLRTFKRVASDRHCLQLAKLYEKKGVLISCPAAFGGKFWAQVVALIGLSNDLYLSSGFSSGLPLFGALDSNSGFPLASTNNSSLNAHLNTLECSLELLMDQVFSILKKLSGMKLILIATPSSVLPLATPSSLVLLLPVEF